MTRLSIIVVERDRDRALKIVDGLMASGDHNVVVIAEETGLARRIADQKPDIVLIDVADPSRDVLEDLALASGPMERPVAMFVDRSDERHSARDGRISLAGAGPGAADLLTVRALRCLQQADIVFFDRLVEPEVLALAQPQARRVFVGKEVGAHSWPQERIDAAIVAAVLQGLHVVRLKSGDPSIFGRAAEEIAAARAHGIDIEVIPGITSASAAAASLCQPLTERGVTDRVVLATATCRPGEAMSDLRDLARPCTTLVFYMAMQQLDRLSRSLVAAGVAPDHAVTIAANVSRATGRSLDTTLARMADDSAAAGILNPALVILHLRKPGDPVAFHGVAGGANLGAFVGVVWPV